MQLKDITGVGYFAVGDNKTSHANFRMMKRAAGNIIEIEEFHEPVSLPLDVAGDFLKAFADGEGITFVGSVDPEFTAGIKLTFVSKILRRKTAKCWSVLSVDWFRWDEKTSYRPGLAGWLQRIADGKLPYFAFGEVVKVEWRNK